MKRNNRFVFLSVLALASLVMGACGPSLASSSGGGGRALAAPVEFTGVVEAIDGNQWTVDGQLVTVDPSTVRDGPFAVGDTVKIKAQVGADGALSATAVEPPSGANGNSNDGNANEDNSNAASDNSNSGSDNSNDDQAGEDQKITGVVEAINDNQITINGVTYTVAAGVDLSGISVGDTVTIEVVANPDGTQTVTEVESGDDDNSNDDNSNDDNSNDDNSNDDNSNDDDDDDNSNDSDDGDEGDDDND